MRPDRHAIIISKHDNQLGKAPSHKLFETVTVKLKDGVEVPRAFADHELKIDEVAIPEGITLIRRL